MGGNKVAAALKIGPRVVNAARSSSGIISLYGIGKGFVTLDVNTFTTSAGSITAPPGPVSAGFSLAAVYFDLEPGFYCEPSCRP